MGNVLKAVVWDKMHLPLSVSSGHTVFLPPGSMLTKVQIKYLQGKHQSQRESTAGVNIFGL